MNEEEIKELLAKKGYELIRITRFKTKDHIHWQNKDLKVNLCIGLHIEDITPEMLANYVP